ncbi:cellobiose phosphorylase [Brachybacterium saurashtrense]|uniref:Cellobiose phosphorylase n=1 Tax=Brachybacterium saurashtrense TaxID=556288 RepID=A0A345YRV6_9MICO|nr:cellobiose phosphorylase [Brachybacterium saurashtrense]AXK46658.1 cellobiose phosphorylase [Brachybacterium saurashtrense]RRR22372.1 cellobiose phosphorylase [Brachybacterium saurashtrense]
MTSTSTAVRTLPVTLERTEAGDAARLEAGGLSLLQYPATAAGSGPAGVHLRLRAPGESAWRAAPLTGPATGGPATSGAVAADGTVTTVHTLPGRAGARLRARTRLAVTADGSGWAWTVHLRHDGDEPVEADLLHTLDAALAPLEAVRRNEQYVAQYLDLTPVTLPEGSLALAVRQNMPAGEVPWAVIGADAPVAQWGTDALQLLDREHGAGLDPRRDLPSERLQHEHTLAALRTAAVTLAPGEEWSTAFWGAVVADHPEATSASDAALITTLRAQLEVPTAPAQDAARPAAGDGGQSSAGGVEQAAAGAGQTAAGSAETPVVGCLPALAPELPVRAPRRAELERLAGGRLHLEEHAGTDRSAPRAAPHTGAAARADAADAPALLSAFGPDAHVVSAAKEREVLRPHGHIQQVTATAAADLTAVASTVWMRGVFCSQFTVGHASSDELTSVRRSYLGLERRSGVRLLHRAVGGEWHLLGVPSAWATTASSSTWLYATDDGTSLTVRSEVRLPGTVHLGIEAEHGADDGELLLVIDSTDALDVQVTVDGAVVPVEDDAALFADARPHGSGLRTAALGVAGDVEVHLAPSAAGDTPAPQAAGGIGAAPSAAREAAPDPTAYAPRLPALTGGDTEEAQQVGEMLAWLAQNAAVHFRTPRGLEQYSGGAWGTRDVCQGPVGLLLATDEPAVLRSTLLAVFAAQQEDGTWPQWFEYLPGRAGPGLRDSHGDVVYWPLRALGEYLEVTGDASLLDEPAPWVGEQEIGAPTSVLDHAARALEHIAAQRTEDPRLPAYGHGDWNDSLQPARPELARHLCSTWTTELEITALRTLAQALEEHAGGAGAEAAEGAGSPAAALAMRCRALADGAAAAFAETLLVDGELAGYALLEGGTVEHLVHPTDTRTGLRHGSLQMIHALADELLTPEQARHHLALIGEHLDGPTGIYLFDRPVEYHGGVMEVFQRAETATFWGREIGLMYMHAHLRYIEALTRLGEAERAWAELLTAVPIGLEQRVRGARRRQANVYYSSSDAVFPDRYTAAENGDALFEDTTGFEGGWRVYSSGPGLMLRLVVEDVLGVRARAGRLEIDPVLPAALDGTTAQIPFDGGHLTVHLAVGETGCGVRSLRVDGEDVDLAGAAVRGLSRRYREAGVALERARVAAGSVLEVVTG